MREQRLIRFGHIQCWPMDEPLRRRFLYKEEDTRRGKGRPKIMWESCTKRLEEHNIIEDLTFVTISHIGG